MPGALRPAYWGQAAETKPGMANVEGSPGGRPKLNRCLSREEAVMPGYCKHQGL